MNDVESSMNTPAVVPLDPASQPVDDATLLGGKGNALAALISDGIDVPPTAIVTTEAYRTIVADPAVAALIDRIDQGEVVDAGAVDSEFADAYVPDWIVDAAATAARRLGGGHRIAVRSSATAEDLAGSSFAGQYRTVLDVAASRPDDVLDAIRLVWASLWHPAPCAYRRALGIDDQEAAMAVVLMEMVPATTSGVVFTVDPGGTPETARVETVEGAGEQLVSGSTTPDFWLVPRDLETPTADDRTPELVRHVVEIGMRIERSFGAPQDIEFAALGDRIFIVQARPITVTPDRRLRPPGGDDPFDTEIDDHELVTAGIAEMLPGVLPPLRWDIDRFVVEHGFRQLLDETGAPLGDRPSGAPLLRRVRGRAALDYQQLCTMMEGIPGAIDELELQYFGPGRASRHGGTDRQRSDRSADARPATRPLGGLRRDFRVATARHRGIDEADVVVEAVQSMRSGRPDLATRSDDWLLAYRRRLIDLAARGVAAEMIVAAAGVASYRRLESLLTTHLGTDRARRLAQEVTSVGEFVVERSLHASAAVIAGPTWRELDLDPPSTASATDGSDTLAARLEGLADVLTAVPHWTRRRILTGQVVDTRLHVVRRAATDAVEQLRQREEVKAAALEIGGEIRRVHAAIADRLARRDLLESVHDVELLGNDELVAALTRSVAPPPDVIDERRETARRHEMEGLLPERFHGDAVSNDDAPADGDRFEGWAASSGRHRGVAQVLQRPTDRFTAGGVLVAEATDASWSPLFVKAGAIVVERGGPLSHAAILARELGVPAVLNVPGATHRLDGRRVLVDGDRGTVTDLESGDEPGVDELLQPPEDAAAHHAPTRVTDVTTHADRGVFIPAIMSVGLLFSIGSLLRDAVRWRGRRSRTRRNSMAAAFVARSTLGVDGELRAPESGLLPRPAYLLSALALGAATLYVTIGAAANYARDGGYVGDIAWLLGVSLAVAAALGFTAGVVLVVFFHWPRPPDWAREPLRHTPLTTSPHADGSTDPPPWERVATVFALGVAVLVTTLLVRFGGDDAADFDLPVTSWVQEQGWIASLRSFDPLGRTEIAVALAALIGLAALRCRVLGVLYPAVVASGFVITNALKAVTDRARPADGSFAGLTDSFPSGHVTQAVVIAWLLPTAIGIMTSKPSLVAPLRLVGVAAAIAAAADRVFRGEHWPLDVIGGAAIGLALAMSAEVMIERPHLHRRCGGCGWRESDSRSHRHVPHDPFTVRQLRQIAGLWVVVALATMILLTFVSGIPTNPEGSGFGSDLESPIQVGLLALYAVGAAVAARWTVAGGLVAVVAAVLIGVFAAVQYAPVWATGITIVLLVPMFLVWLGWQSRRAWRPIGWMGLASIGLTASTWAGATAIHDFYFGPTHPESVAQSVDVDTVSWVWSGGVTATSATVVVGLADDDGVIRVVADDGVSRVSSRSYEPEDDRHPIRLELSGLEPGTEYSYVVEIDGQPDTGRGSGRFTTPVDGPMSFRIAAASCARTGSNGRVFDAIGATEPDLYLALGDVHYSNLASNDPAEHRQALATMLQRPGQAALYREVPVAYVWDDHDYGPNDADGSSPSRDAARAAYRSVVPHHDLATGDAGPIYQAFTVGRVRVIMTDNRSERTDSSMLGSDQLDWLLGELRTASLTHAAVIWANPSPWVGDSDPTSDGWAGYADERTTIADAIADAGIDDLVMVSGDAHMVAIDDGTNTDYSSDQTGGFPLLHAAALDRPGGVKGGPYSHGTFTGAGQFGIIDVIDDGGERIEVVLTGRNWHGDELVSHTVMIEE